jgi:hypothetical protein
VQIPETATRHLPFGVVMIGGRKKMQLPEGATRPPRTGNMPVKVLARGF